jgi:Helix-turn-helix domain
MSASGRPRSLDDDKRRDICTLIAAGCGIQDAARYVGCSVSTIRRELARNREFRKRLRTSELNAQLEPLRAMRKAVGTHWRAAAWMLERTNPQRFARPNVKSYRADEVAVAISDLIDAATDQIQDPGVRLQVCCRLHIAACDTARALGAAEDRLSPKYRAKLVENDKLLSDAAFILQMASQLSEKSQNHPSIAPSERAEISAKLESAGQRIAQKAEVLRQKMGPPSGEAQNPDCELPPSDFHSR